MPAEQLIKGNWLHLCVDMQRIFAEQTDWHVPWLERIAGNVEILVEADPSRTLFTCFLLPLSPKQMPGTWQDYYRKWPDMTLACLSPDLLSVIPRLSRFIPPARIFAKSVYSPWSCGGLRRLLSAQGIETIIVSGAETDVCVLTTVLGAIDLGYRVVVVKDAICSGADRTHDAALEIFANRFSSHLSICRLEDVHAQMKKIRPIPMPAGLPVPD